MKSRPILFSAPMVRALLNGTKTQTRRIVKFNEPRDEPPTAAPILFDYEEPIYWAFGDERYMCPYGVPGDRLWVKETWGVVNSLDGQKPTQIADFSVPIIYRASSAQPNEPSMMWRPSLFMRRWMSRITLEITDVRVERLNEISEADAIAEGLLPEDVCDDNGDHCGVVSAREQYEGLWVHLNGAGSWALSPWVWVIEFRRVTT